MPTDEIELTFEGAQGEELSAVFLRPPGVLNGCALFAHCFTCSKDLRAVRVISQALASHGIATLRFDFTGLGESSGDFSESTFSSNIGDLVAAAKFLDDRCQSPTILIGHSLGGAAVLAAASLIDSVKAVATIGAPADPGHIRKLFTDHAADIESDGQAEVLLAGRRFIIRKGFLDDLETHANKEKIHALGKALLVFHSPQDTIVGIENARAIYQAARHPKSFVSLDGADHLLSRPRDARYVADVLAAWATRYIPDPEVERSEGHVVVEGRQSYFQRIRAGGHVLLADEPTRLGGTDLGPAPYDFLLTALGACTSITLRMYADRKEWPLQSVKVTLKHHRIHAADCEECTKDSGKVDIIERTIEIEGDLDETQRTRLMEIADRCPVHRTLHNEIHIRTNAV